MSAPSFEATLHQLPEPILNKLRAMIGRVRRLLFVRGFFATLATGLVCVLAIMGIDATVTLFSSAARWALSLAGLGITLAVAWGFLIRPLSRKITLTHIARILEIRHPELQERISTAVELMQSDDPDSIRGSEELISAVVDSAVVDVGKVDPKMEFKGGRAARFVTVSMAAAALIALLFAIFPRQTGVLLARAVAPFLNIGNAWADTLVVEPGHLRVAKGSPVTVKMSVDHHRLRRAEIRRRAPDGTESVERMSLLPDAANGRRAFAITFPEVNESFEYRIRAGSAVSEYFTIEAVPRPAVEALTLRYEFPSYTKREPVEAVSETGEIAELANTVVTVTARLNKPVTEASLHVNGDEPPAEPRIEGSTLSWRFPLRPDMQGSWSLRLADADGFKNLPENFPITAIPDRVPRVTIASPVARELRLKPSELLPIRYDIAEDYGFAAVDLLVTPEGSNTRMEIQQPVPESDGQAGVWHGTAPLPLSGINLKPNENRLTVQLRARDNLPAEYAGPNEGLSDKITIILDRNAPSLARQTLDAQKKEIKEAIQEAKKELERSGGEAREAERRLAREDSVSQDTLRDLDDFREKTANASEILRDTAEKIAESVFRQQGEQLEQVAKEEVARAREAADMIPVTDQKDERVAEAKKAQQEVAQAVKDLQEIEKSLDQANSDLNMIAELNDLANEQRELAQKAAQEAARQREQQQQQQAARAMSPEEARKLAEFQRQQAQVQKELGDMLKNNPEALREILVQQQAQAAQLAEQAETLAGEQESLRQATEQAADEKGRETMRDQLVAQLQKMQRQVADETAQLQQQVAETNPEAGKPLEPASQQTRQAAEKLERQALGEALEDAKAAAETLAQASQQPEAENPAAAPDQAPEAAATDPASESPAAKNPQTELAQNQNPDRPAPKGQTPPPTADTPAPAGEKSAENPAANPNENGDSAEANRTPEMAQQADPNAAPQGENDNTPRPTSPAETRERLAELAGQQRNIAQQLQAIEGGQFDEALATMEEQLAEQSESLQAEADALEQATEMAKQNTAKSRAAEAEGNLKSAAQQAQQARQRLAQAQQAQDTAEQNGQPASQPAPQAQQALNQSRSQQQGAQRSMESAAQSLQQAADVLGEALAGLEPSQMQQQNDPLIDDRNLAQSFQDVTESAQSQDSQQAAQQSRQAAESLQQLAEAAMRQMGNPGQQQQQQQQQPNQQSGQFVDGQNPQLNESGLKNADLNGDGLPPELRALGLTAADWARLKSSLQSGAAASGEDTPAEYRELVGRYFRVIAAEAGKDN